MRDLELKAAATYITFLSPNFQKYLWDKEFQGPIIYKNNKFING